MKLAEALEVAVRTDPGRVRAHNEDAVFADAALGIAILADGMGGYNAGEVASGMATTQLAANFARFIPTWTSCVAGERDEAFVEQHLAGEIAAANLAIYNASQSQPQFAGMGTTLVVAWLYENRVSVAHIGDSRLYLLRGGRLEQLTHDHSLLQEQLDSGMITVAEARYSQHKNLVTRALGIAASVETEIHDYPLQAGDILLLCSDGLNDMVDDAEIAVTLQALGGQLDRAADHLVTMANENGGRDNVSVILVKVRGDYSSDAGWWQKLKAWF